MNHSIDDLTPSSVESPESLEELSKSLADINGSGRTAVPWGGGTRIGVGNIPSSYDVALDLSGFTGEIEHAVGDMTIAANAGVTIATLNTLLEKEGQRLPFEVRNPDQATVGGSIASNAPGHRQSSTGGIRDWVIGMQIVLADGTITKSGGRVVKNVQGYELHRLHTGAFGTLGIVSQVAFKLLPVMPEQQSIIIWFDDFQSARDVGIGFVNGLFAPEAISLISGDLAATTVQAAGESLTSSGGDDTFVLLIRLGGGVRSIERQVNEVVGTAGSSGAAGYAVLSNAASKTAWSALDDAEANASIAVRMNARTSDTLSASQEIQSGNAISQANISTICDVGFGAMTILGDSVGPDENVSFIGSVTGTITKYQSSYVIEKCPLVVKQNMDVFSDVGSSIELMRRIKNQYDPDNTLNPGRFAGKI